MMRPQRAFIMGESRAWVSRNVPVRLAWRTSVKSAAFMRRARLSRVMPALLTRTWTAPKRATTAFARGLDGVFLGEVEGEDLGSASGGGDLGFDLGEVAFVTGGEGEVATVGCEG